MIYGKNYDANRLIQNIEISFIQTYSLYLLTKFDTITNNQSNDSIYESIELQLNKVKDAMIQLLGFKNANTKIEELIAYVESIYSNQINTINNETNIDMNSDVNDGSDGENNAVDNVNSSYNHPYKDTNSVLQLILESNNNTNNNANNANNNANNANNNTYNTTINKAHATSYKVLEKLSTLSKKSNDYLIHELLYDKNFEFNQQINHLI